MKWVFSGASILKFVKENPNAARMGSALKKRNPSSQGRRKRNPTVASYFLSERCLLGFGNLRLGAWLRFTDNITYLLEDLARTTGPLSLTHNPIGFRPCAKNFPFLPGKHQEEKSVLLSFTATIGRISTDDLHLQKSLGPGQVTSLYKLM
jgi:hypothetical protein